MEKQFRLVEVEWVDSNITRGWQLIEQAKEDSDARSLACKSVGYVLSEDEEDRITIVQSASYYRDGDITSVAETLSIPTVAIVNVRNLK